MLLMKLKQQKSVWFVIITQWEAIPTGHTNWFMLKVLDHENDQGGVGFLDDHPDIRGYPVYYRLVVDKFPYAHLLFTRLRERSGCPW
jgi:hypothetical protein